MKKIQLITAVFAVVSILLCSPMIAQDVLWYGDPNKDVKSSFRRFDSGNFPQDYCSSQSNNPSSVSTTNDSKYGKVWRIRKPKGQKRGEFARTTGTVNNYQPKDGDLVYYGWRWKISSNPDINNGIAVWQWKTDGYNANNTQNYPLNMGYGNGKLSLNAYGPCYPTWNSCGGSITKRLTTLWTKSIPENTWVSFVVGIKMSRNKDIGYVELWYNGEKQTLKNSGFQDYQVNLSGDKKRAYHKTYDGATMYPKWGAYNGNACNFDVTTYYDEMRIGKTLAAATPSGTSNPPTTGGPAGYTFAANENGTVNVSGTVHIAYGANGKFNYKYNVTNNTACNNATFGDPIPGTVKKCYIKSVTTGGGLSGTYYFQNIATGRYLDSNGATITTNTGNSGKDKQWRLVPTDNGYYNIDSDFSGRGILESISNRGVRGTNTQPNTSGSKNNNREWKPESVGNGIYRFKNRVSGRDYLAEKTNDHSIEYTPWNGNRAQWRLIQVGANKLNDVNTDPDAETTKVFIIQNSVEKSFTINLGDLGESTIQIYGITGHKLFQKITSESALTIYNQGKFLPGVYLIQIKAKDQPVVTKKLLIQ